MRCYIFDVDHNLSTIDKIVYLEKDGIHFDIPSKISTHKIIEEWYILRGNNNTIANANFRDDGPLWIDTFTNYIQETLDTWMFWPSIEKFKEALLLAAPIGINTARWHASFNIKRWIRVLIHWLLNDEEKEIMMDVLKLRSHKTTFAEALDEYLEYQFFVWISSDEFFVRHPDTQLLPWFKRKIMAMEEFLEHVMNIKEQFYQDDTHITIWFSDDEKHNIVAVKARWEENIDQFHKNNIHFVCYDTSATPAKHIITKKD